MVGVFIGDQPAGFARIQHETGYLSDLYIGAEFRGRGLAKTLLMFLQPKSADVRVDHHQVIGLCERFGMVAAQTQRSCVHMYRPSKKKPT